ncbi:sensor protein VraS [mine drainage metagenome]|uniref:Sensor protein VraS n=1 Tax=mine drainage metagenome TaxID=410659 RepID=A0A1J5SHA6_9ZZZZ
MSSRYLPLLVLAASLGLTYQSWNAVKRANVVDLRNDFEYRSNDVINRLAERLLSYKQVLVGVQSLFSRQKFIGPGEFHSYVSSLNLEQGFPGIHSILFVTNDSARKSGSGKPLYAEQFLESEQMKLPEGFLSSPESMAAREKAIASGEVGVTDKISFGHLSDGDEQPGFLMFVPVYKFDPAANQTSKHDTPESRRANCVGFVVGTFIFDDLMAGVLGDSEIDIDIEIFYGKGTDGKSLLYDTDSSRTGKARYSSLFQSVHHIDAQGYPWTIETSSLPDFEAHLDKSKSSLVIESGIGISILLAILVWVLVRDRARALHAASEITESKARITESKAQLQAILDNSPIGIWFSGFDGRYRFVNKAFCDAFGVRERQFESVHPFEVIGSEASAKLARSDVFCFKNNQPVISRETIALSDGKPHLLEITKIKLSVGDESSQGIIGIMTDITEASALQDALQKSRDEMEARVVERTQDLLATKNKLEQEMATRKVLERKVLEVSEEAQAQIGREMHDDLGQLLTGAAYLASSLANRLSKVDQTASKQAEVLKGITQDAIKRSRYISHSLIPFNVADRGLRQGLEQFAEDVTIVSGIPCEVHVSGDVEIIDFMIATNLYRITQEAINNAVKHSKATHLSIDLYADARQILLTIADNGVGLPRDYEVEKKGFGMLNMHYRAQLIGAKLSIDSREGGGTKISLDLPFSENS